jgi:large subunit ribosomal protein L24
MKVKKGDQVTVIAGNDKGKTGRVLQVIREKDRVIVEGVKFVKRHTRPTSAGKGGIVEKEAAIHISNVKKVG